MSETDHWEIAVPKHKRDADLAVSRFERTFRAERSAIDQESRTVELAFSSEEPYERWWGIEILDHGGSSVRLGRLNGGGHPLLVNHDPNKQAGVVEKAWIGDDRKARSLARFGKGAFADEVFNDVMDGIRTLVSVGYEIHKVVEQSTSKSGEVNSREMSGEQFRALIGSDDFRRAADERRASGEDPVVYRVVDWEPFENSLVAIPADPTVGVGRQAARQKSADQSIQITEVKTMTEEEKKAAEAAALRERSEAREAETFRVREISAMGEYYKLGDQAQKAIADGMSVDAFRKLVLDDLKAKSAQRATEANLGLTPKEVRAYSFLRVIHALSNPTDRRAQEAAAFEREISEAASAKRGQPPKGFLIPVDVLSRNILGAQKRDLNVGTNTAGGHLVATDLLAGSFIDVLRNAMVLNQLGVTMLTDLVGNVAIPRQTGGATAYWVAESGAPTESQQAFDQVTLSGKTVGAFTDISRKLLLQSSIDVEAFVQRDLATTLALAIDLAGINGSGSSNQPTGVLNTSGIGDVAGGTNGLAPTWAHIVELETDVAVANAAIGNLAYLTNAKVRGKAKTVEKASSTAQFLWSEGDTPLNGYRAAVSNQVPSNLTKGTSSGVCSAILFGNWADLIIGMWGGLDLTVDPYTGSTSGTVRVVALQDVDVAVRHPESFSAMKDALTT